MLSQIIGLFIFILIGVTLYGPITESVNKLVIDNPENEGLLKTIPFFYIAVIAIVVFMQILWLIKIFVDIDNDTDESEEVEPVKNENHKQTYKDYVKERIEIERMLHDS